MKRPNVGRHKASVITQFLAVVVIFLYLDKSYATGQNAQLEKYQGKEFIQVYKSFIADTGHGKGPVKIFVNQDGYKQYLQNQTKKTSPTGTVFISASQTKEHEKISSSPELYIMEKMPQGYDKKNQNWKFSTMRYSLSEGKHIVVTQGKLKTCISCHKENRLKDFIWSKSGLIFFDD